MEKESFRKEILEASRDTHVAPQAGILQLYLAAIWYDMSLVPCPQSVCNKYRKSNTAKDVSIISTSNNI